MIYGDMMFPEGDRMAFEDIEVVNGSTSSK